MSLAITLIMMGAVVSLFKLIGDSVSGSRSVIELSERLRSTRNRLQMDLEGATATMTPPLRPEEDQGYLEIIEGPMQDKGFVPTPTGTVTPLAAAQTMLGDVDDVLMFTTRSKGEPFVGNYNGTTIESQVVEVMYYCAPALAPNGQPADPTFYIDTATGTQHRLYTLYRRMLLVAPGVAAQDATIANVTQDYYERYDVSARVQQLALVAGAPYAMVPNTLGDLTKRENRFAHYGVFPFQLNAEAPVDLGGPFTPYNWTTLPKSAYLVPFHFSSPRYGDDVLLTNVVSFDVQVFDPMALVTTTSGMAVGPNDPGYAGGAALGAYADLGWQDSSLGKHFNLGASQSVVPDVLPTPLLSPYLPIDMDTDTDPPTSIGTALTYTYDTWSTHYENNGLDDDGDSPLVDEGTDGIDNDNGFAGVVDDPDETETRPPFAAPLRGLRVTIRVYEPSSRQVRQVTVVQDFLPE